MRLFFAGTPEIAVPCLRAVAADVVGVLTAVDKPRGRQRRPQASAIKMAAEQLGLPVLQPQRLDADFLDQVKALRPELMVVFAYGKIFKADFLSLFPRGAINVHPSALPQYRGPSPLPAAILAGDRHYGISIQQVELKMDAGAILDQRLYPLNGDETSADLTARVAVQAPEQLSHVLRNWGQIRGRRQDETQASYCKMMSKEDARLRWQLPAAVLARQIRAYNPWPLSYSILTFNGRRERCNIYQARPCPAEILAQMPTDRPPGTILALDQRCGLLCQTGEGVLGVQALQRQQRRILDAASFACGIPHLIGQTFLE